MGWGRGGGGARAPLGGGPGVWLSLLTISKKGEKGINLNGRRPTCEWQNVSLIARMYFQNSNTKKKCRTTLGTLHQWKDLHQSSLESKSSLVVWWEMGALCAPCHQTQTTDPFALLPIKRKEKKPKKKKDRTSSKWWVSSKTSNSYIPCFLKTPHPPLAPPPPTFQKKDWDGSSSQDHKQTTCRGPLLEFNLEVF